MKYKDFEDYTKEEIDLIRDCALIKGTEYNQKCNRCGEILSQEEYQCTRCGSYDVVDLIHNKKEYILLKPEN